MGIQMGKVLCHIQQLRLHKDTQKPKTGETLEGVQRKEGSK